MKELFRILPNSILVLRNWGLDMRMNAEQWLGVRKHFQIEGLKVPSGSQLDAPMPYTHLEFLKPVKVYFHILSGLAHVFSLFENRKIPQNLKITNWKPINESFSIIGHLSFKGCQGYPSMRPSYWNYAFDWWGQTWISGPPVESGVPKPSSHFFFFFLIFSLN